MRLSANIISPLLLSVLKRLMPASEADREFNPICLKGKYWEVIKLDMLDFSASAQFMELPARKMTVPPDIGHL